jgi:CRISPR system Cascade subunit CasC
MTEPRFIQIHWLAGYPATLLNRDDAGLAKRLPFGGTTRTRVSSQCLKRHWRTMDDDEIALSAIPGTDIGIRSKEAVERRIVNGLADETGKSDALVKAVEEAFVSHIYAEGANDKKKRQALLFGEAELRYLRDKGREIVMEAPDDKAAKDMTAAFFKDKEQRKNISQLVDGSRVPESLASAMFGRMVTSDALANRDAAVHVAHAFTVHAQEVDLDYFTVVDDLKNRSEGDDAGAAGIFDTELTSGLFYGYTVVDVPLLVSNLQGCKAEQWLAADTDRSLAAEVVRRLIHLIATVSPGAKKGSTAPYAWAEAMLIEVGRRQPRTLANAFRKPVPLGGDVKDGAMVALTEHVATMDGVYGNGEARAGLAFPEQRERLTGIGAEPLDLARLAGWTSEAISRGSA